MGRRLRRKAELKLLRETEAKMLANANANGDVFPEPKTFLSQQDWDDIMKDPAFTMPMKGGQ
jgi:hypothetical protein